MKFKKLLLLAVMFVGMYSTSFSQTVTEHNGVALSVGLSEILATQQFTDEKMEVIVTFDNLDLAVQARPQIQNLGGQFIGPKFEAIPMQGVYATMSEVLAMTELEGVIGIWENQKLEQDLFQATIVSSVDKARTDPVFLAANDGLPITGRGVAVVVNDSGIDGFDTDITSTQDIIINPLIDDIREPHVVQVVKGTGLGVWEEDSGPDNDVGGGHGSHCLGIVGGDGRCSDDKIQGVAPEATLIGYGSGAGISILDVQGGFDYSIQHAKDYNIRVISNSFGGGAADFMGYDHNASPMNISTKALTDAGIIVVFSAGNSGPENATITGIYKTAPWVIMAGNGTKAGKLAGSSSRGQPNDNPAFTDRARESETTIDGKTYLWEFKPTVTAPGTDIVSVRATGSALQGLALLDDAALSPDEIPYYTTLTGTSMACPHVAGIAALMLEANPNLEWRAVKAIIQRTAYDMEEEVFQRGAGYVNAHAAVAAAFYGLCDGNDGSYESMYGLSTDDSRYWGFYDDGGTLGDPWRTCPLKEEVADRMIGGGAFGNLPTVAGVEVDCELTGGAVDVIPSDTDETPVAVVGHDIQKVTFHDETATDFKVTIELDFTPPIGAGMVTTQPVDVHFEYGPATSSTERPSVTYILSYIDGETSPSEFILGVRTGDGTIRENNNFKKDISAGSTVAGSTITWTVPKAELDVKQTPAATGDDVEEGGVTPAAGDVLKFWRAYTYNTTDVATPEGPGVYNDDARGTCFITLQQ